MPSLRAALASARKKPLSFFLGHRCDLLCQVSPIVGRWIARLPLQAKDLLARVAEMGSRIDQKNREGRDLGCDWDKKAPPGNMMWSEPACSRKSSHTWREASVSIRADSADWEKHTNGLWAPERQRELPGGPDPQHEGAARQSRIRIRAFGPGPTAMGQCHAVRRRCRERPQCANSGRSAAPRRTGQVDPLQTFEIDPVNWR
jgi:hypothetical protein